MIFEILGENREVVFFGDTKRQCLVDAVNSEQRIPIYAAKFFSISPYTEVEHLDQIAQAFERALAKMIELEVTTI